MNPRFHLVLFVSCILTSTLSRQGGPDKLDDPLKPFVMLVGKTWKGEFKNSTPDKPMVDVVRWERALNGKAVRVLHSINDGWYGGETFITWDAKKKSFVYWYFTTAGFRTEGTMKYENNTWTAHETVTGGEGRILEVKSTTKLLSDGSLSVSAEYFQDGKWGPGREAHYKPAPDAKVIFK